VVCPLASPPSPFPFPFPFRRHGLLVSPLQERDFCPENRILPPTLPNSAPPCAPPGPVSDPPSLMARFFFLCLRSLPPFFFDRHPIIRWRSFATIQWPSFWPLMRYPSTPSCALLVRPFGLAPPPLPDPSYSLSFPLPPAAFPRPQEIANSLPHCLPLSNCPYIPPTCVVRPSPLTWCPPPDSCRTARPLPSLWSTQKGFGFPSHLCM